MIVVTGGAGFIGSNIVMGLNAMGERNIVVVDDLSDGAKFRNLADAEIADYYDKDEFLSLVEAGKLPRPRVVFHQGACSATTEWNGKFVMDVNYRYSKVLLSWCMRENTPFIYASSASVYGSGVHGFTEKREFEKPLNMYAYSKFLFDQYVRDVVLSKPVSADNPQVVGLRYFNVYGPREMHKGSMASVAFHFNNQIRDGGNLKLFEGSDGYGPGEQRRDFVHVDDIVAINLWFWKNSDKRGIFNAGTGRAQTFNDVAKSVTAWWGKGAVEYVPFPDSLKGRYQSFTQADLTALQNAGYDKEFMTVEAGVKSYLDWQNDKAGS